MVWVAVECPFLCQIISPLPVASLNLYYSLVHRLWIPCQVSSIKQTTHQKLYGTTCLKWGNTIMTGFVAVLESWEKHGIVICLFKAVKDYGSLQKWEQSLILWLPLSADHHYAWYQVNKCFNFLTVVFEDSTIPYRWLGKCPRMIWKTFRKSMEYADLKWLLTL